MTSTNRQFTEFTDDGNGVIRAVDREGYPVKIDPGEILEVHDDGDQIKAGWEDIVCPVLFHKGKTEDSGVDSAHVSMSIDECVETLVDAVDSSVDTGFVGDVLASDDADVEKRRARVLIEYLIDEGVLPMQGDDVVLLNRPDVDMSNNIIEGEDGGTDYLLTQIGVLERIEEILQAQYEQIEAKFDRLEDKVEEQREEEKRLKNDLDEARKELYDLTGGERLEPEERNPDGSVKVPPQELDSSDHSRYKLLYNQINSIQHQLKGEDAIRRAKESLNDMRDEYEIMQRVTSSQINKMRTTLASVYEEGEGLTLSPEERDRLSRMINNAATEMNHLMQVNAETEMMPSTAIWGEEIEEHKEDVNDGRQRIEKVEEEHDEIREIAVGIRESN